MTIRRFISITPRPIGISPRRCSIRARAAPFPNVNGYGYNASVLPKTFNCFLDDKILAVKTSLSKGRAVGVGMERSPAELVHRLISGRPTVGFKRDWMLGASEERIRCDT